MSESISFRDTFLSLLPKLREFAEIQVRQKNAFWLTCPTSVENSVVGRVLDRDRRHPDRAADKPIEDLDAWLWQTVHNVLADKIDREVKLRDRFGAAMGEDSQEARGTDPSVALERQELVSKAMDCLSEIDQKIAMLWALRWRPIDIADALRKSERTIGGHIAIIKRRLEEFGSGHKP